MRDIFYAKDVFLPRLLPFPNKGFHCVATTHSNPAPASHSKADTLDMRSLRWKRSEPGVFAAD